MNNEKTICLLKPSLLSERDLGNTLSQIESVGLKIEYCKTIYLSRELCEVQYAEYLDEKPVFENIFFSLSSGPTIACIFSGKNATEILRKHIGYFEPHVNSPDTIRGKYMWSLLGGSCLHASDDQESYLKETNFLLPEFLDKKTKKKHPEIKLRQFETKKYEKALFFLKPEAIKQNRCGDIIFTFEKKGFKILCLKTKKLTRTILKKHYEHILKKDPELFEIVVKPLVSKIVVVGILEGINTINEGRKLVGATNPLHAAPGTIRGKNSSSLEQGNFVHFSDSNESYQIEKKIFFPKC